MTKSLSASSQGFQFLTLLSSTELLVVPPVITAVSFLYAFDLPAVFVLQDTALPVSFTYFSSFHPPYHSWPPIPLQVYIIIFNVPVYPIILELKLTVKDSSLLWILSTLRARDRVFGPCIHRTCHSVNFNELQLPSAFLPLPAFSITAYLLSLLCLRALRGSPLSTR